MDIIITILWIIAGFGALYLFVALLSAGGNPNLFPIVPPSGKQDWPRGVQEMDVPRFAVEHLDSLRPSQPHAI